MVCLVICVTISSSEVDFKQISLFKRSVLDKKIGVIHDFIMSYKYIY